MMLILLLLILLSVVTTFAVVNRMLNGETPLQAIRSEFGWVLSIILLVIALIQGTKLYF
jgi:hypothetical protein